MGEVNSVSVRFEYQAVEKGPWAKAERLNVYIEKPVDLNYVSRCAWEVWAIWQFTHNMFNYNAVMAIYTYA